MKWSNNVNPATDSAVSFLSDLAFFLEVVRIVCLLENLAQKSQFDLGDAIVVWRAWTLLPETKLRFVLVALWSCALGILLLYSISL
jgi:hypothetical protein